MLSAMEGAGKLLDDEDLADAMKDKGLGTPATRATIIETLIAHKVVERDRRDLLPTARAESLITFLNVLSIDSLTSPSMTGDWEQKLRLIERKELTRREFMSGIEAMTTNIVEKARNLDDHEIETHESTSKNCALVDGREEKQASLLGTHGGHDAADNPHNGGNCAWGGVNLLIPKKLLNRTL